MNSKIEKEVREFKILYHWLQIARKKGQNLAEDVKLIMELIKVPVSIDEVQFLIDLIDPNQ